MDNTTVFRGKKKKDVRVLFKVEIEDGGQYEYLLPRIKRYDVLKMQEIEARTSGNGIVGSSFLMARVIDNIASVGDSPKFSELLDMLDDEGANALLEKAIEISLMSITALESKGYEIR